MLTDFKRKLRFSRITYSELESLCLIPQWLNLYQQTFGLGNGVGFHDVELQSLDWRDHECLEDFSARSEGVYLSRSYRGSSDTGNLYFGKDFNLLKRGMIAPCVILLDQADVIASSHLSAASIGRPTHEMDISFEHLSYINLFDLPLWSHVIFFES